jgi:hypothetical protein
MKRGIAKRAEKNFHRGAQISIQYFLARLAVER